MLQQHRVVYIIGAMNEFKAFFLGMTDSQRGAFADSCKTTVGHLRNVAYGKKCGEDLAMRIERYSDRAITAEMLRPDLADEWNYIRSAVPAKNVASGNAHKAF